LCSSELFSALGKAFYVSSGIIRCRMRCPRSSQVTEFLYLLSGFYTIACSNSTRRMSYRSSRYSLTAGGTSLTPFVGISAGRGALKAALKGERVDFRIYCSRCFRHPTVRSCDWKACGIVSGMGVNMPNKDEKKNEGKTRKKVGQLVHYCNVVWGAGYSKMRVGSLTFSPVTC
jgi:hypothetical protein